MLYTIDGGRRISAYKGRSKKNFLIIKHISVSFANVKMYFYPFPIVSDTTKKKMYLLRYVNMTYIYGVNIIV